MRLRLCWLVMAIMSGLIIAITSQHRGGAAQVILEKDPENAQQLQIWAALAEAYTVLRRFAKSGLR